MDGVNDDLAQDQIDSRADTAADADATEQSAAAPKKTFAIIFGVSLVTAMGNTGMISVLPAIGRSIGIPDPMVAAIFSLSALLWAFSSPWWARASDRHGRKPHQAAIATRPATPAVVLGGLATQRLSSRHS